MTASQFLIEQRNQLDRLCTYDIPLWIRAELENNKFVHLVVKDIQVIKVDEEYRHHYTLIPVLTEIFQVQHFQMIVVDAIKTQKYLL